MFEKQYHVKIYSEGQSIPTIYFSVMAISMSIEGHTLIIDGTRLKFAENQYIVTELAPL